MGKAYIKKDLTVGKYYADVEGGAGGGASYSTDEVKIGKWIDGSDLYEKTFDTAVNISSNTRVWTMLLTNDALTAAGIDEIVAASGVFHETSNFYYIIPTVLGTSGILIGLGKTENGFGMCSQNATAGTYDIQFTIRYTKTS